MPVVWPSFEPFLHVIVCPTCTYDHCVVCSVHYAMSLVLTACGGGWLQHVGHGGD